LKEDYLGRHFGSYQGYSSEAGLRNAIASLVEERVMPGPANMPNLIICGKFTVYKQDGLPFINFIGDTNSYWLLYSSARSNPFYYLVEMVLTRLSYKFRISIKRLDDLKLDAAHPLLFAKPETSNQSEGWEIKIWDIPEKRLEIAPPEIEWEPTFINDFQSVCILLIVENGLIDLSEDVWDRIKKQYHLEQGQAIRSLLNTGILYYDGSSVRLIEEDVTVTIGILPDGRQYVTDGRTDRLELWLRENFQKT